MKQRCHELNIKKKQKSIIRNYVSNNKIKVDPKIPKILSTRNKINLTLKRCIQRNQKLVRKRQFPKEIKNKNF